MPGCRACPRPPTSSSWWPAAPASTRPSCPTAPSAARCRDPSRRASGGAAPRLPAVSRRRRARATTTTRVVVAAAPVVTLPEAAWTRATIVAALAAGLVPLAVYLATLSPTVNGGDSGEFIAVAYL